jgi:2-polyprenyl-3-methyl-5-hydroxy-6-metoxy-1,4-benzoquinol methylase
MFAKSEQAPNYEHIFNTYVKYQGQRVANLQPYLGKDKTLLDVGCSTGHFIQHMHGKVKEAVGVDWDIEAIAYAEMRTGWRTYSDLKHIGQKFDIVYSSMTMEHTSDPLHFLQQLKTKMKKNGTIYIEVPNLNDALYQYIKTKHIKSSTSGARISGTSLPLH